MASVFGHALTAVAIGNSFKTPLLKWKFWILGMVCSILPDADIIGYKFGIAYTSFWGHRGFSHSLLFAFIIGVFITLFFYRKQYSFIEKFLLMSYFTLATASHALLDAFTDGGYGVAFLSPWNNTRYFFPWRPIKVSPLGVESFFSEWGLQVIKSELIWIGAPCLGFVLLSILLKRIVHKI